jgi:hypothetical protein
MLSIAGVKLCPAFLHPEKARATAIKMKIGLENSLAIGFLQKKFQDIRELALLLRKVKAEFAAESILNSVTIIKL